MEKKKMSRKAKIWLFVILGVVVTAALIGVFIYLTVSFIYKQLDKYELDDKTRTFLEAVVEQDDDKLRTVADASMPDAHALHEELENNGCHLEGEVKIGRPYSVQIGTSNGVLDIKAVYSVKVGGKRYSVTVHYKQDEEGSGIDGFYIK